MGEVAEDRGAVDDFFLRLSTRGKSKKFQLDPPKDDPLAAVIGETARTLLTFAARAQDAELAERANPDHVRVRTIPPAGVEALTIWMAPYHIIAVNQGLALFLYRLARAFAPHIIVRGPEDPPAPPESEAIGVIATLLDWMASPVHAPLVADWPSGPREIRTAEAYARMAERFVLAHEIAHILRGHLIADAAKVDADAASPHELDQRPVQQEMEADVLGCLLAVDSTQIEGIDPRAAVTGISYFFRALQLGETVGAIRSDVAHRSAEERLALCNVAIGERYGKLPDLRRGAEETDALLARLATAALAERDTRRARVAERMDEVFRTTPWTFGERDPAVLKKLFELSVSMFSQSPSAMMEALGANLLDAEAYKRVLNTADSKESLDGGDPMRRHQIALFIARYSPTPVQLVLGVEPPLFGGSTKNAD